MGTLAVVAAESGSPTVLAAFAVGLISFISPCVLPLVPGYLSAISGVSMAEIQGNRRSRSAFLGPAVVFCLSFTVMFVALGMTATGLGSTLRDHLSTLDKIAGGFIVAMGVFMLAAPLVPRLNATWHPERLMSRAGSGGPVLAGLAFAVAWTPCVGPTLTSILAAAATSDTVGRGGLLLAWYSAGLAVPFLLTAVAFERMALAFAWIRRHYAIVTAVSGLILITMGLLMLTGQLTRMNIEAQRGLQSIGLDIFNR